MNSKLTSQVTHPFFNPLLKFSSLVMAAFLFAISASASVQVGAPAPDFSLTDSNGKSVSLSQFKGKYTVLEWTNCDCPFVKKHYNSGNMQKLQKKYTAQGVVWLSVVSSAPGKEGAYTPSELNARESKWGAAQTAILIDSKGAVGKMYGAKTTPHVFVINPQGLLVYQGAIDDHASADASDIATSKNFVAAALDESMAGKAVTVSSTKPYGCSVKY